MAGHHITGRAREREGEHYQEGHGLLAEEAPEIETLLEKMNEAVKAC